MKKYLLKKQIRDFIFSWRLYLSILLICLFGMVIYSGFNTVKIDLLLSIEEFYQQQNLADYTIKTNIELPNSALQSLIDDEAFDEVVPFFYSTPSSLYNYYQFKESPIINKPYMMDGSNETGSQDIIIDYDYAMSLGRKINGYIKIDKVTYRIVGLAKFPQALYKGNRVPSLSSKCVFYRYDNNIKSYNSLFITSKMNKEEIRSILSEYFGDESLLFNIVEKHEETSYERINSDFKLINRVIFIFPTICLLAIVFILYINYHKLMIKQGRYIGILKANGFSLKKLYLHFLTAPLLTVILGGLSGSLIGIKIIPNIYINSLSKFYTLPPINLYNRFEKIVFPVLILLIISWFTISLACFFTLRKMPVSLINQQVNQKLEIKIFRNIILPYHYKYILRNIITYFKKTILILIASSILLAIIMTVYLVDNSFTYVQSDLVEETIKADYSITIYNKPRQEVVETFLEKDDSPILEINSLTYLGIKTIYSDTFHRMFLYNQDNPVLDLKDQFGNQLDLVNIQGVFIPRYMNEKYGINIGDYLEIALNLSNSPYGNLTNRYKFIKLNVQVGSIIEEKGDFQFGVGHLYLKSVVDLLPNEDRDLFYFNYFNDSKTTNNFLIKLKQDKTESDLHHFLNLYFNRSVEFYPLTFYPQYLYEYQIEETSNKNSNVKDGLLNESSPVKELISWKTIKAEVLANEHSPLIRQLNIVEKDKFPVKFYQENFIEHVINQEGCYISSRLANYYGLHMGDEITFKLTETLTILTVSITGIIPITDSRYFASFELFITQEYFNNLIGDKTVVYNPSINMIRLKPGQSLTNVTDYLDQLNIKYKKPTSLSKTAVYNLHQQLKGYRYLDIDRDVILSSDLFLEIGGYTDLKVVVAGQEKSLVVFMDTPAIELYDSNGTKVEFNDDGIFLSTADSNNILYPIGTMIKVNLINGIDIEMPVAGYYHLTYFFPMVCSYKSLENNLDQQTFELLKPSVNNPLVYVAFSDFDHQVAAIDFINSSFPLKASSVNDIYSIVSSSSSVQKIIEITKVITTFLCGFLIIILIYNIGLISITERIDDIKIFKALGYRERRFKQLFSLENYVIIIISGFIAIPIASLFAQLILQQVYVLLGVYTTFKVSVSIIIIIQLTSLFFMYIANKLINARVSRLNLATLLKRKE